MKKIMSVLLTLSIIMFTGCGAGVNFSFENAQTVKVGDTTDELIQKMGNKPYSITTKKAGDSVTEVWVWTHVSGVTFASKVVSFIIKDGKVIEVPYISKAVINQ